MRKAKKLPPISPGEMLMEEFLKPMGISKYRLAKEIGVPAQRIGEIVAGRRAITADTDLRLSRFFGLSEGWWLRGQVRYDLERTKDTMAKALDKIRPWSEAPSRSESAATQ
jgi:addiction module HigA family antidote